MKMYSALKMSNWIIFRQFCNFSQRSCPKRYLLKLLIKMNFFQASTPLQSHADLGIDPLDCRDCGRRFSSESVRARHELDVHQIRSQPRSRPRVARNILGGRGNAGSDSDSSMSDSTIPLASVLPSPPQHTLSPVPPSPPSLSPISSVPLSPISPLPQSPTSSPPQSPMSPLSPQSSSPPSSQPPGSLPSGLGGGIYTCNVCLCTFTSYRYYRRHQRECR